MRSGHWIAAAIASLGIHGILFLGVNGFLRPQSTPVKTSIGVSMMDGHPGKGSLPAKSGKPTLSASGGSGHGKGNSDAPGSGAGGASSSDQEPVLIGESQPPYPPVSRRLGEEGQVGLLLKVNPAGEVLSATVTRSSGYARLDEAALKFGKEARFQVPAQQSQPVEKRLTIRFELGSQDR